MRIGFLGAGAVGKAIAGHAVAHGHEVVLSNSRGPESLADLVAELGPLASAATPAEAASADLVVLAVPWTKIAESVHDLPAWDGRVVVDATNQFVSVTPTMVVADLGDRTGSEVVADLLPGARVVKAFNTMFAGRFAAEPKRDAGRQVLFLAGDDADAKELLAKLADSFGFAPIDLGGLRAGGTLMQLGGPLSGVHLLKED